MSILYYLYLHQRVKKYIYYRQYSHTVGLLSASKNKKVRPKVMILRPKVMILRPELTGGCIPLQ